MTKTPANDGDHPSSGARWPFANLTRRGLDGEEARLMYDVINSPRASGIIIPGGGEVSSVKLGTTGYGQSCSKWLRGVGGELDVSQKDERTQSNLTVRMFHITPPSLGIPEGGHLSLFRAYVCKENYERIYRICARYAISIIVVLQCFIPPTIPPTSATRNSDCHPGHLH